MNAGLVQTIFQAIEARKGDREEVEERYKRARLQGADKGDATHRYLFEYNELQSYYEIPASISFLLTEIELHIKDNPIPTPTEVDPSYIAAIRAKNNALTKVYAMRPLFIAESSTIIEAQNELMRKFERGEM